MSLRQEIYDTLQDRLGASGATVLIELFSATSPDQKKPIFSYDQNIQAIDTCNAWVTTALRVIRADSSSF